MYKIFLWARAGNDTHYFYTLSTSKDLATWTTPNYKGMQFGYVPKKKKQVW